MALTNATTFRVCEKSLKKRHSDIHLKHWQIHNAVKQLKRNPNKPCIFQTSDLPEKLFFANNGMVNTVMDAYNNQYNLILRPDDVWTAIITQFSFYVNKHAEEFQGKFVNFEEKRELVVTVDRNLRLAPYDTFVKLLKDEIDRHLVDPEVKKWILPNFSTTTDDDFVTAGVLFMGNQKKNYYPTGCHRVSGIPSVTLSGTIEDWENIHQRLGKLKEYKLSKWYAMLEPILMHFVIAKKGKPDLEFWNQIVCYQPYTSSYICGWITAFCTIAVDGNMQTPCRRGSSMQWLRIDADLIPTGAVVVNLKINDSIGEYKSSMFAGHFGMELKYDGDTVQPALGWIIALKADGDDSGAEIDHVIKSFFALFTY